MKASKRQVEKFRKVARELGCDGDKDAFEAKLKQITKAKRAERKPKKPTIVSSGGQHS